MFLLLPLPTLGYGRSDPSSSGAVAFDKDLKELAGAGRELPHADRCAVLNPTEHLTTPTISLTVQPRSLVVLPQQHAH